MKLQDCKDAWKFKHGMCGTRLYAVWNNMVRRCGKQINYTNISVCEEWKTFLPFMKWAKENGYKDSLVIDRIDSSGNYCPNNCRFVTVAENNNNKSNNHVLTINGVSRTIAQWANIVGVKSQTIYTRISRGWRGSDLLRPTMSKGECLK